MLQSALTRALTTVAGLSGRNVDADLVGAATVTRPRNRRHGDWSSTIALQTAKSLSAEPRRLAAEIADRLRTETGVGSVSIAGPGFLNITLDPGATGRLAAEIVSAGRDYGRSNTLAGLIVGVECAAAIPLARPHLGHSRQTALGDVIARLFAFGGAQVTREYCVDEPDCPGSTDELRELIAWLGADALRYALVRTPADSPMTMDPDVLRTAGNENPVFCVQYAHARARRIERTAVGAGIDGADFVPSALDHESEAVLLAELADFPRIAARAAELREPHRIARYLECLAGAFHAWSDSCRVTPPLDEEITVTHSSRLVLVSATIVVLRSGLELLGVTAPERI